MPLQITPVILLSTAFIIGGCLVMVIFGDHTVVVYTVDQLIELYKERVKCVIILVWSDYC